MAWSLALTVTLTISPLFAAEKIRFGLNWLREAEHCGFFSAKAAGHYHKAGLDAELKPGGLDVNAPLLVGVGQLDLAIGTGQMPTLREWSPLVLCLLRMFARVMNAKYLTAEPIELGVYHVINIAPDDVLYIRPEPRMSYDFRGQIPHMRGMFS